LPLPCTWSFVRKRYVAKSIPFKSGAVACSCSSGRTHQTISGSVGQKGRRDQRPDRDPFSLKNETRGKI
jgi:hypothetical protein